MRLELSAAPTAPAVAVGELRQWLAFAQHVTEDDGVLRGVLEEEYDRVERETHRKLLTQTWNLWLDAINGETPALIHLPLVPLVSVSSITTYDDDGDDTVVSSSNYQVVKGEDPRVILTPTGEWPSGMRDLDSMKITAVCGYSGNMVPFVGFVPTSGATSELDDMSAGGTYTGTAKTLLEIVITTAATPDVFKWRKITRDDDEVPTVGAWTTGVDITGSAQTIADGITVTFAATTGHTVGSKFTVEMYERLPATYRKLLKGLVINAYSTKGQGVTETVSGQLIGLPQGLRAIIRSLTVTAF